MKRLAKTTLTRGNCNSPKFAPSYSGCSGGNRFFGEGKYVEACQVGVCGRLVVIGITATQVVNQDMLEPCDAGSWAPTKHVGKDLVGESLSSLAELPALQAYSQAISKSPDIVVLCNRSLVQLKLEEFRRSSGSGVWLDTGLVDERWTRHFPG